MLNISLLFFVGSLTTAPAVHAPVPARPAAVLGTVRDSLDHPLEGALVQVGTLATALTDAQGAFRLYRLPVGEHTLTVSGLNLKPYAQTLTLREGETLTLTLRVGQVAQALREVVVAATALGYVPEVDGTTITAGKKNELIKLDGVNANLALTSTRQVFAKVPGLMVWENDGSGQQINVATRGLSPNRSWEFNVRQNGYDISSDAFGYPEAYFNPPLEAVDRIQIIRGGAGLQFGPQFGGLLNYEMKRGAADKKIQFETSNTAGSNGLLGTYNAVGGTVGKVNYYAYYQQRGGDGWRANSQYRNQNARADVRVQLTPKLRVGAEITGLTYRNQQPGGLTDAQFAADPRQSPRARNWISTPWLVGALTADYDLTPRTHASLKVFGLAGDRNSVGFTAPINVPDSVNRRTREAAPRQLDRDYYRNLGTELRVLTSYPLAGRDQTLAVGLRAYRAEATRQQQGRGTTAADFDLSLQADRYGRQFEFATTNYAAFAEHIFRLGTRLSLTPGLRFEHIANTASGYLNLKADGSENRVPDAQASRNVLLYGAGTEFQATAGTSVYANYSRAFRPVLFSDLTPPATTDVVDPNLRDARGFNAELGYRGAVGRVLRFDVDAFYLRYDDRIGLLRQPVPGGPAGATQQLRTNLGTSVSQGLESYVELDLIHALTGNLALPHLDVFGALSFIDARYTRLRTYATTGTGAGTTIAETDLSGNRVENAPRYLHRLGATAAYKGVSVTYQHSLIGDAFADANNTDAPNAAATTGRIASYRVADLTATARLGKDQRYTLRAGVNNLFDAMYFTRRSGGYPGPGILPADGRTWFAGLGLTL